MCITLERLSGRFIKRKVFQYRRKVFLRKAVQERKEKSRNGRGSADLSGFDAVFS